MGRKSMEEREMDDVIARLRESEMAGGEDALEEGRRAGEDWAKRRAEARELRNLERLLAEVDSDPMLGRDGCFDDSGTTAYSVAENVYFAIRPAEKGDRVMADDFWDCTLGTKHPDAQAVRGFCEGAAAVWEEVKDSI